MKPLLYLFWRQFTNSFRRAARTPRVLIPGLIIGLGLGAQFGSSIFLYYFSPERGAAGMMPAFAPNELLEGRPGAFVVAVRGALALSTFTAILSALGEGSLVFLPGDIDFLFPAPVSRRSVLFFKMAGRYLSLLAVAAYLTFALGMAFLTARASPLSLLPGILGVWLFLVSVTNAAQTALLNRAPSDKEAPNDGRAAIRRIVTFTLLALLGVAAYLFLARERFVWQEIVRAVNSETVTRTILPDAWAAELFRAAFDGWHWGDTARLVGLVTLCGLSFVWLFSRERDFYEGAIELSAKRLRTVNALQKGDAGSVLSQMAREGKLRRGRTLRDFGTGARAILWKDCVAATRIPLRSYLQLLIPAAMPALIGGYLGGVSGRGHNGIGGGVGIVAWMFFFALQTPALFMLGLRDMLRRADISRALPIAPLPNLAAEIALPILQLTILGWLSLALSAAFGLWRGPLLPVAFLILPTLTALLYFVQTVFVLLYPRPNDAAQTAVSNFLSLFLSLLAVLPGVAVGMTLFIFDFPFLLAGAGAAAINLLGAMLALLLASRLWARFDPTD